MEINKIDVNDKTINLNLEKIINNDNETNIIKASKSHNVWMPNSYNNLISEASGVTTIDNPGILQFSFTHNQNLLSSLPFQNKITKVDLQIESEQLIHYELQSNHINNKIIQDTDNQKLYHLELSNNDLNNIIIMVPESDTLKWKLTILDNQQNFFNLTFTPNYLQIIRNCKNQIKHFKKKQKNSKKMMLNLQLTVNKIKNKNYSLTDKIKVLSTKDTELTKIKQKLKDVSIEFSDLKIEDSYKRIKLTKSEKTNQNLEQKNKDLEQKNKKLNDENLLIKTSIDKYRIENKKLVTNLKKTKDTHTTKINEINNKYEDLEKTNSNNVRDLFIKEFENKELTTEHTEIVNELNKTINTIKQENEVLIEELEKKNKKTINQLELQKQNEKLKIEIDQHVKTNKYLYNEYRTFYYKKNKELTKQNKELTNQNKKLTKQNKELEKSKSQNRKSTENLELDVIDLKLKNTELELIIERLEKKKNKSKTKSKLNEIFDWYKNAMPQSKNIKFKNNELMEFIRNLESEITSVFTELIK